LIKKKIFIGFAVTGVFPVTGEGIATADKGMAGTCRVLDSRYR
jgi:hypothetical protein